MPFVAKDLIPETQKAITVKLEDSVSDALNKMIMNDYSQLPVIDHDKKPIGLVTSDSIMRSLRNFDTTLVNLKVRDVTEDVSLHRADDDIFEVLEYLKNKPAVIIIKGDGQLSGLVTPYDTTQYFRRYAQDMMLVEDIETGLTDHIEAAFTNSGGDVDEAELQEAISVITNSPVFKSFKGFLYKYRNLSDQDFKVDEDYVKSACSDQVSEKDLADLTFDQYINLLLSSDRGETYGKNFSVGHRALRTLLEDVRDIRNRIAHFRGELNKLDRRKLLDCVDWLKRNPPILPDISEEQVSTPSEEEVLQQVQQAHEDTQEEVAVGFDEEEPEYDSRYTPLANYLRQHKTSEKVRLTFSQVETIISDELPPSAYKHRAWWANDSTSHVQSREWLSADWRVSSVNMSQEIVTFSQIKERQKRYIEFFSKLLRETRDRADFPIRENASPRGDSYIGVQYLSYSGTSQSAKFVYSFARGNRFRVELYIRSGDKNDKRIFDYLDSEREEIEDEFGSELNWERLDKKQASRIAVYHEGSITDTDEDLEALKDWAVDKMIDLHAVLSDRVDQAFEEISDE